MPEQASGTAARVAAYRLRFERVPGPYGDAAADEALARDVAGPLAAERDDATDDAVEGYLRGRTAFFDHFVVSALARDVAQVVSIGAGYDGRALRYRKDGTRWWEVDRPATQSDKRERLRRLGVECDHVTFLAHDLQRAGLATALAGAGFEPEEPAIMLCEGVAVYLEPSTLASTLRELRSIAAVATRLAISLRTQREGPVAAERRERFEAAVAALGEPVHNALTAETAAEVLREAGWRAEELPDSSRIAGLVVLLPS